MTTTYPDKNGRFGDFGGKYVPETLMNAIEELEAALEEVSHDDAFALEYMTHLQEYAGSLRLFLMLRM
ncbi:tryptophan synthase beta chain [Halalkalibacter wakoensis JCM 9140]|uniref:Tryptophan synthase beta chain n=1 Tax=Halalkalibacter wakoensis JCM 9140 TaxID=1236970 RepID=W4Q032_9BACI|nr:tryptophan synthase beta chain [Halalkalibacter wakoensis JCM 9140]